MGVKMKYDSFEKYSKKLEKAMLPETGLVDQTAHLVASKVLPLIVAMTPYRDYELPKGRKPGDLVRGWTGGRRRSPERYGLTWPLYHSPGLVGVYFVNSEWWASYVEYGHRQHPGQWVPPIQKRLVRPRVEGTDTIWRDVVPQFSPYIERECDARFNRFCKRQVG